VLIKKLVAKFVQEHIGNVLAKLMLKEGPKHNALFLLRLKAELILLEIVEINANCALIQIKRF
jgi:hypothetical protein